MAIAYTFQNGNNSGFPTHHCCKENKALVKGYDANTDRYVSNSSENSDNFSYLRNIFGRTFFVGRRAMQCLACNVQILFWYIRGQHLHIFSINNFKTGKVCDAKAEIPQIGRLTNYGALFSFHIFLKIRKSENGVRLPQLVFPMFLLHHVHAEGMLRNHTTLRFAIPLLLLHTIRAPSYLLRQIFLIMFFGPIFFTSCRMSATSSSLILPTFFLQNLVLSSQSAPLAHQPIVHLA